MKKDTEEIDQIDNADEAPSTRDSIRAAIEEVNEKASGEEVREKTVEPQKVDPADKGKEPSEPVETKTKDPTAKKAADKEPEQLELDLGDKSKKVDEKVEPTKKEGKAPFGLSKELRAKWDNFDPETQGYLAKVVKENLDLKSNEGRKYAHLRDVDAVLTPYIPAMEQWKVTPAQLVQRLLQYSDALASPQYKYQAIAKLANDFGVDLTVFAPQTQQGAENTQAQQQELTYEDYIPPEVDNKLNTILSKFDSLEAVQQNANTLAARDYVNNWAGFDPNTGEFTKKPYLPYVRQSMHNLIANGTIPIVDGAVDLDAAYETACYINPQIREHMSDEQSKASAVANEQKRQQQIKAAQKAKFAGSSIRSGAPAPIPRNNTNKPNSGKQHTAIRDSIRAAINEVGGV